MSHQKSVLSWIITLLHVRNAFLTPKRGPDVPGGCKIPFWEERALLIGKKKSY